MGSDGTGAQVVIIGAGIVGISVADHLARRGWNQVTVVDQGPIPKTGGSTSHAPGLVFQTNPSRTMTRLASYTVRRLGELRFDGRSCFHAVGGIEVAYTAERWADLQRKHGLATSWGVEAHLISPEEVAKRFPLVDPAVIHGGFWVPSDGIAKPLWAAEAIRAEAGARGVAFRGGVTVTGIATSGDRVTGVHTSEGLLPADIVVCAAGIWGPRIGALAGVSIPLVPVEHQYVRTTPVPGWGSRDLEVAHPILRHQDAALYVRQLWDCVGVGSYQHEPIAVRPEDIASPAQAASRVQPGAWWHGQPSVHRFTPEDFKQAWADVCELLPRLEEIDIAEAMNGMFSFTPDGNPVLGPAGPDGFFVAEAVWITHGPGVGKVVADWLVDGRPSIDVAGAEIARFEAHATTPDYVLARGLQNYREVYDIIHPQQPMAQPRPLRTSPFYLRERELGAFFLEAGGWERPHWYEANADEVAGRDIPARDGWSGRYWSPTVGAEHLVTRERAALFDMATLRRGEVGGPGALGFLQRLATNDLDKPVGRVSYTLLLDDAGGIVSDITVARTGESSFQVAVNSPRDFAWLRRHLPTDGSVDLRETTAGTCCVGLWGPRARDVLAAATCDDVADEAFRFFRCRRIRVGEVPVLALRVSYVGELGWELYTTADLGLRLWDLLMRAGADHGLIAAGRGAFEGMRLEKGYRSYGADMTTEDDPDQAGLSAFVKPDKGWFVGRDALLARRDQGPPTRRLACLTLDEPGRVVMGSEPVLCDDEPVGWVTSAGYGYTVGAGIAYAWVPAELAEPGTGLQVAYFGERLPATVRAEPLFDPTMARMRA